MKGWAVLVCFLMISACVSTQKAVYLLQKRKQLANVCAKYYPVRDSLVYRERVVWDTAYIPFDSVLVRDTCIFNGNVVVHSSKIPCPPERIITKTIFKDSIIYRLDSAKMAIVESEANDAKAKASHFEESLQSWRKRAFIELIVIIFLVLIIFKPFKL